MSEDDVRWHRSRTEDERYRRVTGISASLRSSAPYVASSLMAYLSLRVSLSWPHPSLLRPFGRSFGRHSSHSVPLHVSVPLRSLRSLRETNGKVWVKDWRTERRPDRGDTEVKGTWGDDTRWTESVTPGPWSSGVVSSPHTVPFRFTVVSVPFAHSLRLIPFAYGT